MLVIKRLFLALAAVGLAATIVIAAPVINEQTFAAEGANMSASQAAQLETKLMASANDLASRVKLLGYYTNKTYDSTFSLARQRHGLWVIEHRPDCATAGLPYTQFDPVLDGQVYQKAKNLWLKNIKAKPKSAPTLANAALFFMQTDETLAEQILLKAATADPKSPAGPRRLGELYLRQSSERLDAGRSKLAAKALVQFEKALKLTPQCVGRFHMLTGCASAAFESGDMKKAGTYSNELLVMAEKFGGDLSYGDAVHRVNLVRGRVALRAGDVHKAKACLIAAGSTPGSTEIQTVGPGMELARELLAKGERDVVLQYLDLCEGLWEIGRADIESWKKTIGEGKTPDFGS